MYFGKGCRILKSVYRGLTRTLLFRILFYSSQEQDETPKILYIGDWCAIIWLFGGDRGTDFMRASLFYEIRLFIIKYNIMYF